MSPNGERVPQCGVEMERRILGPPEDVFQYFVDPVRYREWQGVAVELDPRPGGIYRVTMNDAGFVALGQYVEVEPPRRVVFTWGWEGNADIPPGTSVVEVVLRPDGGDTILHLRHSDLPDEPSREIHAYGWTVGLDDLVAVARQGR